MLVISTSGRRAVDGRLELSFDGVDVSIPESKRYTVADPSNVDARAVDCPECDHPPS